MTPFEKYWSVVPVKVKRKLSEDIWKRKKLDDKIALILSDIETRKRFDDRWLRGFIPDPPTYLRQERWTDEIVKPFKAAAPVSAAQTVFKALSKSVIDTDVGRAHVREILRAARIT